MNKFLTPKKVFLFISIVFCSTFAIITPLFHSPDEINHFYRAWQVSSGNIFSITQDNRTGGYIPKSLDNLSSEYLPYTLNVYNKISPEQSIKSHMIELNEKEIIFKDFPNTALYPAILYIPQAIGINLGRMFNLNPYLLVYLGRFCNVIFFISIGLIIIQTAPFKKWLFVMLLCLPMSLFIHSSLSADVMLNSISFLLIVTILNLSFNDSILKITLKDIILLLILSLFIGFAKLIYVPLLLVLFLIPAYKFKSNQIRLYILSSLIFLGLGSAYIQKTEIDAKYIPYSEYNVIYRGQSLIKKDVDMKKQLDFVIHNPKQIVKVFITSFFNEFDYMTKGYIGIFGWGDILLPDWFVYLSYFVIFIIGIINYEDEYIRFSILNRIYLLLISLSLIVLIMLSQYLIWDIVGEGKVYTLQGRYFIPAFPIFFLSLVNIYKYKKINKLFPVTILFFCIFSGLLSIYLIIENSYTDNQYSKPKWELGYSFKEYKADTDSTKKNFSIRNNDTIAIMDKPEKCMITSDKQCRANYSLKLSKSNPYGFTTKIFKAQKEDKIVVSCKSYGYEGYLVIQEYPAGIFFRSGKTISTKDSMEWKYKEIQFILPKDISSSSELRIYAFCPDNDSVCFDDFKISYFSRKK